MDDLDSFIFDEDIGADNDNDGYSSDGEISLDGEEEREGTTKKTKKVKWSDLESNSDNEMSSLTTAEDDIANGNYSSSDGIDSDDDTDDNDHQIEFLTAKCRILTRVSRVLESDKAYTASIARLPPKVESSTSIWNEAKAIMKDLTRPVGVRKVSYTWLSQESKAAEAKQGPAKKLRVDTSSVQCMSATAFDSQSSREVSATAEGTVANATQQLCKETVSGCPRAFQPGEMKSSCAASLAAFMDQRDRVSDKGLSARGSVTMSRAISITHKPQLILHASYPFNIVHANKAFFNYSALSESISGQPAASVLDLSEDLVEKWFNATLPNEPVNVTVGDVDSQVQILPVSSDGSVVSHLLVQICDQQNLVGSEASTATEHANILVGTVG